VRGVGPCAHSSSASKHERGGVIVPRPVAGQTLRRKRDLEAEMKILHINDSGCLCETCGMPHHICAAWDYVCAEQTRVYEGASFNHPEVALQMRILKCSGYSPKETDGETE